MSEVKRYDMRVSLGGVESYESTCGDYVDYEDYAELEAKCAALAAENAVLKDYLAPIGLKVELTPSGDAFLDEIRAQGVEMLLDVYRSRWISPHVEDADRFAAQLRKGVYQK